MEISPVSSLLGGVLKGTRVQTNDMRCEGNNITLAFNIKQNKRVKESNTQEKVPIMHRGGGGGGGGGGLY